MTHMDTGVGVYKNPSGRLIWVRRVGDGVRRSNDSHIPRAILLQHLVRIFGHNNIIEDIRRIS